MFKINFNLKVLIFILLIVNYAFNAKITGTVTNRYTGAIIKDATVKLTSTNSPVATDSLGKFNIESTGIRRQQAVVNKDIAPELNGNSIQFAITSPQKIKIEQFNLNGRKIYSLFSQQLKPGVYDYNLNTIVNKAAGVYIIKVAIGQNSQYFKSSALKSEHRKNTVSNSSSLEKNNMMPGLSKRSAVIDTLVASHPQYALCKQPVYEGVFNYQIKLDTLSKDASLSYIFCVQNDLRWSIMWYDLYINPVGSLTEFRDTVNYSCDSVKYVIKPTDMNATITFNSLPIINQDSGSTWFRLKNGNSIDTFTFTVTASNGIDSKNYKILTFKQPDTTTSVKDIKLSVGTPLRGFVADSSRYVASVDTATNSLSIRITPRSSVATITVNNTPVSADSFSLPIPISAGRNIITAIITAQNGINKDTVFISVVRGITLPNLYLTNDYTIQKASFPYLMTRNIIIDTNATLTIDPGVSIFADSGKYIEVRGTLLMAGTSIDSIRISAIDTTRPWNSINYLQIAKGATYNQQNEYSNGCILRYCVLDNAGNEKFPYFESTSYVISSQVPLSVSHVHIRNCNAGGILLKNYGDNLSSVDSTIIEKVNDGLHIDNYAQGYFRLLHVTVRQNKLRGIVCNTKEFTMKKCTVENNSEGVNARNAKSIITECTIKNNECYGMNISAELSYSINASGISGLMTDCEIIGNGNGNKSELIAQGGIIASSMKIRKCMIKDNVSRGKMYASAITAIQNVVIDSNIIINNTSSSGTVRFTGYQDTLTFNLISNNTAALSSTDSADKAAIIIDQALSSAIFNNNIINPQCQYEISNKADLQSANFNARNNYWGKTTTEEIGQRIYDWYDDDAKSKVLFEPFLTTAEPAAPSIP
jgi:hypothetical protein